MGDTQRVFCSKCGYKDSYSPRVTVWPVPCAQCGSPAAPYKWLQEHGKTPGSGAAAQ